MALGTLAPVARQQFLDANGDPLAFGKLFTYLSGLATPSPIYTNAALTVAHPNPAIFDGGGYLTIYQAEVSQKWVVTDLNNVTQWTVDPVGSVGLSGSGGDRFEVFEFGGDSTSPITWSSYPTGSSVDKTHAGTALFVVTGATLPAGTYGIRAMILEGTGGSVEVAIVNLNGGDPDTPLAVASGTSFFGASVTSGFITFPVSGIALTFGIKVKTNGVAAFVWGVQLIRF